MTPTYRATLAFPGYSGVPQTFTYATPRALAHQLAFLTRAGVSFEIVSVKEVR